jgi:chromosome condensin MukBEF ATPase and DNA-binding subunit MukB
MSHLTERRLEKLMKKLIGKTEIEDALKRLDRLTQDEARMATAQILKVTHTVDNRVRAVDDKLAEVMNGVQPIFNQLSTRPLTPMHLDRKEARTVMQQTADDVNQMNRPSSLNPFLICGASYGFCRKPSVGQPSQMALPTRPIYKS